MEFNFTDIEKEIKAFWAKEDVFHTEIDRSKPKYYMLDMFPYPSGAGLHVGHPLGYVASDIVARFKRLKGFNVLHPMGYDSFGLPAEQYAIQTGQHPAATTDQNIKTFREQMDKLGFSYEWRREIRTSDPAFYKWTQWIFIQLFHSWYNIKKGRAEPIESLILKFESKGSSDFNEEEINLKFTAEEWRNFSEKEKSDILLNYRLAYIGDSWVNWCAALGTVLANDEVKDGVSERGGYPVERKLMKQWSLRITAYADRLLDGLDHLDWSESIKEAQRNWIGRSEGCSIRFKVAPMMKGTDSTPVENESGIEVFTTRPDTIFGVSFITLAPEHDLVDKTTTDEYRVAVQEYVTYAKNRSERERMADVKKITGQFTGAYAIHPFSRKKIPIWVGEYVLGTYGTGAVMGVPGHDSRDNAFARYFGLPVIHVIIPEKSASLEPDSYYDEKEGICINSFFLTGLHVKEAIKKAIEEIEKEGFGKRRINYRMRDAIFGRQRYWGEPIPVYYDEEGSPHTIDEDDLPLVLPEVDKYLPTESGEPPLARAKDWVYTPGSTPTLTPVRDFIPTLTESPIPAFPEGEGDGSRTSKHYETANKKNYHILKGYGRRLKNEMTDAEKLLWEHLRHNKLGYHFRRQHIIGNFIADFLCMKERLIVEVDGPVHEHQKEQDAGREVELKNLGFRIIRFSNDEVINNTEAVLQRIRDELEAQKVSIKSKDFQKETPGKVNQESSNLQDEKSHEDPFEEAHPKIKLSAEASSQRKEVSPNGGDLEAAYIPKAYPLELTTMPGWAGSSWYYLRYEDPHNDYAFASKEAIDYWRNVDFYLGGDEHATGHLLYFRFWTKFLFDRGWIPFDEPTKKLLNQGKIQGISHMVARVTFSETKMKDGAKSIENIESLGPISFQYVSFDLLADQEKFPNAEGHFQFVYAPLNFCKDDKLDIEKFKNWIGATERDQFIFNSKNEFVTKSFAEKMSKSKYNVVNPDDVVGEYGADAFRMYEMFLGPIEQHKPWDTKGIDGVYRFLKKLWRLFYDEKGNWLVTTEAASNEELKALHKAIKKVEEDIERLSFNTSVSAFMICVNELTQMNSHKIEILQPLLIILSPYAPFITEYLWGKLDNEISIVHASFPKYDPSLLEENAFEYPIAVNGKTRVKLNLPLDLNQEQIEKEVLSHEALQKYLDGKTPKKVIVVKGRMINVVV